MPNLKGLRNRIRSVKNTTQLTRTMSMIAASKMRRAQDQAITAQSYSDAIANTINRLTTDPEKKISHPFLSENRVAKSVIVLLSTDKGLCGALNTNLFREVLNNSTLPKEISFYNIGRKGKKFAEKNKLELLGEFEYLEAATEVQAETIFEEVKRVFLNKVAGKIYIAYPKFLSTLKQEPVLEQLLPITTNLDSTKFTQSPILEPGEEKTIDFIINHYVFSKIFQVLTSSKAAEHSARMVAMQNATDNAKKLADELTLEYNKVRQETITRELLDIAAGSESVN